jgi:haloalkane dehalogenase
VLPEFSASGVGQRGRSPDPRAGVFSDDFPYESKYTTIKGHKIHYIDAGEGDTFLFLHGNPTSMYLWRNVMRYIAPHGRIVALDNIGFGKSEQPEGLSYTYQMHYEYVEAFIKQQKLKKVILIIHDWGSVLGLQYAMENSRNVKGVVFMEAIIPPAFPMEKIEDFGPVAGLFSQFRQEASGKEMLIEQNMFIEGILLNGAVTRQLSDEEKAVYHAPFKDKAKRFPIYVWPNELPIGGTPERNVNLVNKIGKWLERSRTPKLLQYVSPGAIISPEDANWMAENYRNIETQFVGYGAHYIQEDNPEVIGRGIVDWYRRSVR